jgi:hypothetical protein
MQREDQDERDAEHECVNCGHAERFHERGSAKQSGCTSPEDGTRCECEGFEPV